MNDSDPSDPPHFGPDDVASAEKLAGIEYTDAERRLLLPRAREQRRGFQAARAASLPNHLAPALRFDPEPPPPAIVPALLPAPKAVGGGAGPGSEEEIAFAPVGVLAGWLRAGQLSSLELTRLCLRRLERYGPGLRCLVTTTEELALGQARRADDELARGVDRGLLHGIPYGAKDLLAVPGYPTGWGAEQFRGQVLGEKATVAGRLEEAGAVLVAKLSLGELAMGDVWYGGKTRSPRETSRGSSGSSAGSAAAVAGGLVPFAIGSETMGSIVSPATRCGVIGHRPSANLVPRSGAMALAWSLDKLGPLARSVDDCAAVLQAIAGPDGLDASARQGFEWHGERDPSSLRVGFVEEAFEGHGPDSERNRQILAWLREAGVDPIPLTLPDFAAEPIMSILMVEAAAAFDELVRSDRDDELAQQGADSWPNLLRAARLVPAVEYVQANRLRAVAVSEMARLFGEVDVYLCPSSFHRNLYLGNATGVPTVVVPAGFDETGAPLPWSMNVTAGHYRDAEALLLARRVAEFVGPLPHPELESLAAAPAPVP